MRLFLALDLPEPARDALEALQAEMPAGRPVDPETMHLTMVFLGDLDEETAEAAHTALEGLRHPPVEVTLRGLGTFGARRPQVLFAGVRDARPLAALRAKLLARLRAAGIAPERRRFRPHVTLARFPGRLPAFDLDRLRDFLEARADAEFAPFTAEEVLLFRSHLRPGGAEHEALAAYPLA